MSQNDPIQHKVVHVYDDIEEEDNRLPNWWVAILVGSIVFSFGYWFVYHTAKLRPQPREVYEQRVAELVAARIAANPSSPEAIVALSKDPEAVAAGAEVFRTTCAACHGLRGEGIIGPNLTDRYWIHGARPEDVLKAVTEGFATKGMPGWGPMLGPERSIRAAAYVLTLRNTNVPGKEPQGEPVD